MQINDAWNWIETSFYGMMSDHSGNRNYFISRISTLFFICVDRLFTPYFKVDRLYWIARSAITRGSCIFNAREHYVSRDASERKRNLRAWRTPPDEFGFLDWNIYFDKGCNYSKETNEMM